MAYSVDTEQRNRINFLNVSKEVADFLKNQWNTELDYKLKKELWSFSENMIAVRFEYEFRNVKNEWFRAYGNENWEFEEKGLRQKRYASINDLPIKESERRL